MARHRTYSDQQLVEALASSTSWRGALRGLGLSATSSGSMRSVRLHADRLGLDYAHFRSRRGWDEDQLRHAVAEESTWADVIVNLGVRTSTLPALKGHVARLGIDASHLHSDFDQSGDFQLRPQMINLGRSGSLIAAAWFTLAGCDVSWPLEASRYDLLVGGAGDIRRVQVKTTVTNAGSTWKVFLSTSRGKRRPYDPDEIDDFFIVDGGLNFYLIPVTVVGGLHAIHLSAYSSYWVGSASTSRDEPLSALAPSSDG